MTSQYVHEAEIIFVNVNLCFILFLISQAVYEQTLYTLRFHLQPNMYVHTCMHTFRRTLTCICADAVIYVYVNMYFFMRMQESILISGSNCRDAMVIPYSTRNPSGRGVITVVPVCHPISWSDDYHLHAREAFSSHNYTWLVYMHGITWMYTCTSTKCMCFY